MEGSLRLSPRQDPGLTLDADSVDPPVRQDFRAPVQAGRRLHTPGGALKGRTRTTASVKVRRISPEGDSRRSDRVVAEEPLEIRVEGSRAGTARAVSVTMRTPGHDFELAAGFLAGEGQIGRAHV